MPIICYREKINVNGYEETVSFAFNCIYDEEYHLKLKDYTPNFFDCGDFSLKIEETTKN